MDLAVVVEQRYFRTPDGRFWAPSGCAYKSWEKYLKVFSSVRILARVQSVDQKDTKHLQVDGPGVNIWPITYYVGPFQYACNFLSVASDIRAGLAGTQAVILRIPGQLSNVASRMLRNKTYAVEVVGDPYDVFSKGSVDLFGRSFIRFIAASRMRHQCHHAMAARYVTTNYLQKRYPCPNFSIAASDVCIPDSAINAANPTFPDGAPWEAAPASRPFRIVVIGSLSQMYKGVDVLLLALSLCLQQGKSIHLDIVGDGMFKPFLMEMTAKLGLNDAVSFLGEITGGQEIFNVLDCQDLFILPSRTEGLPRAMIEAMARGLPCIGSRVGGIPELLSDEDTVEPGDVNGLASRLIEVMSDLPRMKSMSRRNLAKAREFRQEKMAEKQNLFYQEVLAGAEKIGICERS